MVNHRYKRAVLGITTALVVSACTVPAMAAPITINTDQSLSVVSTDSTYVGGLDLEARIIQLLSRINVLRMRRRASLLLMII